MLNPGCSPGQKPQTSPRPVVGGRFRVRLAFSDSCRHSGMPSRRPVEQFEFRPPTTAVVVDRMRVLSEAGDGWLNLLPGVPEEEAEPARSGVLSTLFGTARPPVSMCTWMPAASGRRGTGEQSIGILHPRGRRAAAQLAELGVPVPSSWRVSQDHARRGLIVHPLPGASPIEVLDWTLRAGAALAGVPLTGTWQARVFLPVPPSPTSTA